MSGTVSESRFFMWRAIVAMAHADKIVQPEEDGKIENYLSHVPFSEEQKKTLRADIHKAQDIHKMFSCITQPEDRAEFFQFARILCWCDGDTDGQEEAIMARLTAGQMDRIDRTALAREIHASHHAARFGKLKEDLEFKDQAHKMTGLGNFLSRIYW